MPPMVLSTKTSEEKCWYYVFIFIKLHIAAQTGPPATLAILLAIATINTNIRISPPNNEGSVNSTAVLSTCPLHTNSGFGK